MPLSNEELGEHIASLERLLQGNPAGQTAALTGYVHKLEALTRSGDHEPAEKTLQLLGTAVGGRKRWQTPFRDSGILAYALRGLSTVRHEDPIAKQYLRVIGNSVADNDTNRELVVRDMQSIAGCLASPELRLTALAVLFNLCNDFGKRHQETLKKAAHADRTCKSRRGRSQTGCHNNDIPGP